MNEPVVVYPPNRPMDRIIAPSKTPVLYDYLAFIDTNNRGEVIVGCSNLTGNYWEGTLFFYQNGPSAVTNNYSEYYISASTLADAKFVNNSNQVIVAEDTGYLRLLSTIDQDSEIKCEDVFYTAARIQQLATWNNSCKVVGCADTTVAIWDFTNLNNPAPLREFKDYHTELITSVHVKPNEINLFASTSVDRRACIWDDRMQMPALVLYQNEFASLMSVAWNLHATDYITVGSQGGDIYNLDIRQPKQFVDSHRCFEASIHHMAFNNLGYLAVCGDCTNVVVLNSKDNMNVSYESKDHGAFVRGLAWFEDTLYSCGFDKKFIKHMF